MPIQKYLDPKNDIAFRRLFGTEKNKGILIHFLNDVLARASRIESVEFLPTSILDKWIYFFKHAEEGEHFPSHLMQEVTIHEALDEMKSFNWTEEELLAYEKIEDEHYAYVNNMEIAKAEARAEGMEKGIEKGRMEEKFEVARNLKQLGLDDARIIVATGLTDAQLKAL